MIPTEKPTVVSTRAPQRSEERLTDPLVTNVTLMFQPALLSDPRSDSNTRSSVTTLFEVFQPALLSDPRSDTALGQKAAAGQFQPALLSDPRSDVAQINAVLKPMLVFQPALLSDPRSDALRVSRRSALGVSTRAPQRSEERLQHRKTTESHAIFSRLREPQAPRRLKEPTASDHNLREPKASCRSAGFRGTSVEHQWARWILAFDDAMTLDLLLVLLAQKIEPQTVEPFVKDPKQLFTE